jgi:hypothetical protein
MSNRSGAGGQPGPRRQNTRDLGVQLELNRVDLEPHGLAVRTGAGDCDLAGRAGRAGLAGAGADGAGQGDGRGAEHDDGHGGERGCGFAGDPAAVLVSHGRQT